MRVMIWVSAMWGICFSVTWFLAEALSRIPPDPSAALGMAFVSLVIGSAYLFLLGALPAILFAWLGLAVWRATAPRKRRVEHDVIISAQPPAAPPPARDAGHRWLS